MRRVVFAGILVILWACAGGCFPPPPPRDCSIESLVVDESPFPQGAVAGSILSPLPQAPRESAGRTIYLLKGIANHDVHRYRSASQAAREFQRGRELDFSLSMGGPWETPDALTYRSPIANQYHVACGLEHGIYMCTMIAQYEEYYIFFNAHMSPDAMTFQDLERVLLAIDERMAKCLGKPLSATH